MRSVYSKNSSLINVPTPNCDKTSLKMSIFQFVSEEKVQVDSPASASGRDRVSGLFCNTGYVSSTSESESPTSAEDQTGAGVKFVAILWLFCFFRKNRFFISRDMLLLSRSDQEKIRSLFVNASHCTRVLYRPTLYVLPCI